MSKALLGCTKCHTIIALWMTAPKISNIFIGNSSSNYVGSTASGEKILYVPENSIGYDGEGMYGWGTNLIQKCGFTLSATL